MIRVYVSLYDRHCDILKIRIMLARSIVCMYHEWPMSKISLCFWLHANTGERRSTTPWIIHAMDSNNWGEPKEPQAEDPVPNHSSICHSTCIMTLVDCATISRTFNEATISCHINKWLMHVDCTSKEWINCNVCVWDYYLLLCYSHYLPLSVSDTQLH